MSEISDYADAIEAHLTNVDTGVAGAIASIANVAADVAFLKSQVGALTPITAEDKARLDAIVARVTSADTNVAGVAKALSDLDALTPPPSPVAPAPTSEVPPAA